MVKTNQKETPQKQNSEENIRELKNEEYLKNMNASKVLENEESLEDIKISEPTKKFKLLDIKNDYVFKRTFGYKGDENITKILLQDILQIEVNEINLDVNLITEKELLDDKVGIMDIATIINNNVQVDVEMQIINKDNIEKRLLYYWNELYRKSIHSGNDYEDLKRTIVIMIADFELKSIEKVQKYFTEWEIREKDYPQAILTDTLKICIIELPKYVKYKGNNNSLNLWTEFFRNPEVMKMSKENIEHEKDEKLKRTKTAIIEAKETLEKISQNKHEQELARLRDKYIKDQIAIQKYGYKQGIEDGKSEGIEIGRSEGIEIGKSEGIEIGSKNKSIQIVKKMLEEKINIELISKVTGISVEEIQKM